MKGHFPVIPLLLALPLGVVGCEAPEPETEAEPAAEVATPDLAAEEQAIRDRVEAWEQAANESPEAFASFYTSEGVLMAPNAPVAVGPAAIVEAMGPTFEMVEDITFEPLDIQVAGSGDLAVERGRYTLAATAPDGSQLDDEGSYLVAWVKQDGQWMVAHDIFNSDRPASDSAGGS